MNNTQMSICVVYRQQYALCRVYSLDDVILDSMQGARPYKWDDDETSSERQNYGDSISLFYSVFPSVEFRRWEGTGRAGVVACLRPRWLLRTRPAPRRSLSRTLRRCLADFVPGRRQPVDYDGCYRDDTVPTLTRPLAHLLIPASVSFFVRLPLRPSVGGVMGLRCLRYDSWERKRNERRRNWRRSRQWCWPRLDSSSCCSCSCLRGCCCSTVELKPFVKLHG